MALHQFDQKIHFISNFVNGALWSFKVADIPYMQADNACDQVILKQKNTLTVIQTGLGGWKGRRAFPESGTRVGMGKIKLHGICIKYHLA